MSSTLSSIANKTNEFSTRAFDVENTKIVYIMNQMEYDNPLLNHPEILKELSMKFGITESEVINIFSSFDKAFVEESCIAGNVDILYDSLDH